MDMCRILDGVVVPMPTKPPCVMVSMLGLVEVAITSLSESESSTYILKFNEGIVPVLKDKTASVALAELIVRVVVAIE